MIQTANAVVHLGNNLDILPTLPDNSVDSIVTDPPYELGFMGKSWDSTGIAYSTELWKECLRVLKPGGHLLSFGGSRTWHRIAVAIEDSGFQIRDSIAWMYGSGFPKSLDVSKAIDKAAGAEREVVGTKEVTRDLSGGSWSDLHGIPNNSVTVDITKAATEEARTWEGWGTALKPAFEPVIVARKPLIGTVAENVLTHGTGALNIDGTRITTEPNRQSGWSKSGSKASKNRSMSGANYDREAKPDNNQGRWPANVILDEYTAGLLDEQSDASRFFYCAKASKRDRNEGLEGLPTKVKPYGNREEIPNGGDVAGSVNDKFSTQPAQNFHPTVKPTDLMRYLVKLVTPPGGTVLDPFTGSGSTGKAAILEGLQFIGIELTEDYLPIIEGRLKHAEQTILTAAQEKKEELF